MTCYIGPIEPGCPRPNPACTIFKKNIVSRVFLGRGLINDDQSVQLTVQWPSHIWPSANRLWMSHIQLGFARKLSKSACALVLPLLSLRTLHPKLGAGRARLMTGTHVNGRLWGSATVTPQNVRALPRTPWHRPFFFFFFCNIQ